MTASFLMRLAFSQTRRRDVLCTAGYRARLAGKVKTVEKKLGSKSERRGSVCEVESTLESREPRRDQELKEQNQRGQRNHVVSDTPTRRYYWLALPSRRQSMWSRGRAKALKQLLLPGNSRSSKTSKPERMTQPTMSRVARTFLHIIWTIPSIQNLVKNELWNELWKRITQR